MPRIRMTDRSVKALRPRAGDQVDYFDDRLPRFGMRVSEKGHKSWIVLYRCAGRLRRLTLGPYPAARPRERARARQGGPARRRLRPGPRHR